MLLSNWDYFDSIHNNSSVNTIIVKMGEWVRRPLLMFLELGEPEDAIIARVVLIKTIDRVCMINSIDYFLNTRMNIDQKC